MTIDARIDKHSLTWRAVVAFAEKRLALRRSQLEEIECTERQAAGCRMAIETLNDLLKLVEPPKERPEVPDAADSYT